jgi:hypothetical protein
MHIKVRADRAPCLLLCLFANEPSSSVTLSRLAARSQDIILSQAYNKSFFRKGDARTWFKMDVTKFGRLYDWFDEELGWFPWSPHPSPSAVESMKEFGLNPKSYSRAMLVPSGKGVGGMVGSAHH